MVDIDVGDAEIRVTSPAGSSVAIGVGGWSGDATPRAPSVEGEVPVDESVSGHVTRLRLPSEQINIEATDIDLAEHVEETGREFFEGTYGITDSTSLPRANYRVQMPEGSLVAYLEFEGPAEVRRRSEQEWVLSFDYPTQVAFGFRDTANYPRGTVTVPPTPSGLATAISAFPASLRTTTPDRSFPSLRVHPPRIEFGDETAVPDAVADRAAESRTGVEFEVPDRLAPLFVLAPLSYYLGATVEVGDVDRPVLRAPSAGVERTLPACPDLQWETGDLLRRVFWLDCLARNAGPHGTDLLEVELAREAGLDPDLPLLYRADPQRRLRRYLDVDPGGVEAAFPAWPFAVCVDPSVETARGLPYAVNDLATVYLAEDVRDAVDPPDCQRGRPPTDPPTPGPSDERVVGWLADGPTESAFQADVGAMRRWPEYADVERPTRTLVVGADPSVADRFRTRGDAVDPAVTVEALPDPTTESLQEAFASDPDLVYYAGEDATRGLSCSDGRLWPSQLSLDGVGVVVLDAPNSLSLGRDLVEGGSVCALALAGDAPASLGTAPAELLLFGAPASDALWVARRYAGADPSARVVGAGARGLPSAFDTLAHVNSLRADESGDFEFGGILLTSNPGGLLALDPVGNDSVVSIDGRAASPAIPPERIGRAIDESVAPIVYEGEIYWPDEHGTLVNPIA